MRFVGLRLASGVDGRASAGQRGRSARPWRIAAAVLTALLLGLGLGSGCHDNQQVGRPCDPGPFVTNDGATILLSEGVTECPSGICLAADNPQGTGPLCTAGCQSNDDCDGELANPNDPSDTRCKSGFVCMWPTTVGTLNCQRLCACRDVVSEPAGGFRKPTVCP